MPVIKVVTKKLGLLVADTQQRWSKNLSQQGLGFLSKQLKPRRELVCTILFMKNLYSCFNLLLLHDYVLRENSTQTACVQSARSATKYAAPSIWLWTAPTSKRSRLHTQNCSQLCKMRMQIVDWSTQTYLPKFHFKFCRIKSIWIRNFQSIKCQVLRGSLSFANSTWEGERYAIFH